MEFDQENLTYCVISCGRNCELVWVKPSGHKPAIKNTVLSHDRGYSCPSHQILTLYTHQWSHQCLHQWFPDAKIIRKFS